MYLKDSVTLFLLTFDTFYKCPAHIICIHDPHSTWTSGRNALAKEISRSEEAAGKKYKYWSFHDADTWDLSCERCR
jgi:hypothetical protein